MKKKLWIAIGIITLLAIMISVSVYRQVFAKGPAVTTANINEEEISSQLLVPGTVKLQEVQQIFTSPEKGEVKELLVSEGQEVKSGTVLAKLDNPQLELEIEQNKIAIESANLKVSNLDKQIKQLKEKKAALKAQVGEEEAKKQMDSEQESLEMEKKLADLDLKQANLQKDLLQKKQNELEIKSTIDGVVLKANKTSISSAAGVTEPLIQIGKIDSLIVTGLLSEYDTLKVNASQKVSIKSDAVADQEWQGEITAIGMLPEQNQTVGQTGSQAVQYPVTVKITGDTHTLKPGFQVIMEIETEKKKAKVIPIEAVHDDGRQPYVYLVEQGRVKKQNVKIGISSGKKMEVINGLASGESVIVKGPEKLKDGMDVTIK
ncbi:efflux RND transporter periplasmic adaptor subunit [Neobacillus dielmonensis]|uniref:efflux RND transporter periplasmic adaptor subunit n=1 Tax=Neobacillus dielmonensis TaxID=1347369 RepID=UPI0005A8C47E|nr:efflux RND transporter periplasmic adaptor subunit [Neobacillus dielmonensis]